ncbi:cell cycle control protein (Cwf19), putative [Cordyceps militaris CM01]|uniref:Cell cycle control protein (Cwf19), putative n=1 Tax=Cordyceps militaris (strain CM01) TaxID=983644 RepID=G3JT95_CORMM|nr:cell cycle control protein (Cwf19), putative [Cordyceps militaris CM01]EGX88242.1 cell cycle control protein (Cwf19), putative [Cordyceps militaris CM01]
MDGLDEFEKNLAAEKAQRERPDDRKKHHHRHHRDRSRRRHRDDDDDHKHKRRRRSRDGHDDSRHDKDRHRSDRRKEAKDTPSDEPSSAPVRDAWMTAPSALAMEHIHRPPPKEKTPPKEPARVVSVREINRGPAPPAPEAEERVVDYSFGDAGSGWRMTKLRGVYTVADDTGRPVDEVALERFGSLREFDEAREEKQELDRASSYGKGYAMKEKPTGDFYKERPANQKPPSPAPAPLEPVAATPPAAPVVAPMDQTALNRLRAQMIKAKLRRAPNAAQLEEEYNRAAAAFTPASSSAVVLGGQDSRLLAGHVRNEVSAVDTKRGRARGTVVANDDMSVDDMLREERRTKGQAGGEGMRLAERIAKDGRFDDDLAYMDENAERLATRVHKSEANLKNTAVHEFQKVNRILDSCPLCRHDDTQTPPLAPVLALATRVFLTLATEPEVSPGSAVIVPTTHRRNLLECDDDEWEELRNFMKSLTRMYHAQGRDVLFYENAAAPHRHLHAALHAVPIPYEQGAVAPAFFKEALLAADEEWAQHQKIIDTGARARDAGLGRMAFRRSLAKEMPYFHVWFTLDGGLGHVVEDAARWPRGDLFARQVIAGIVDAEPQVAKKQGRWRRGDHRVEGWQKEWRKYDWTRVLAEGG